MFSELRLRKIGRVKIYHRLSSYESVRIPLHYVNRMNLHMRVGILLLPCLSKHGNCVSLEWGFLLHCTFYKILKLVSVVSERERTLQSHPRSFPTVSRRTASLFHPRKDTTVRRHRLFNPLGDTWSFCVQDQPSFVTPCPHPSLGSSVNPRLFRLPQGIGVFPPTSFLPL